MFRSLLTLLLFAGLNNNPFSGAAAVPDFDPVDLLTVSLIPKSQNVSVEPVVEARAAILMDLESGVLLYKRNPYERMAMASLTKIMTAALILESHDLNEIVTIRDDYNQLGEKDLGVRIWLQQYEKITVENLLIALLVRSGGDAALALAKYHSGSVEAFVDAMNKKAEGLNLKGTHFVNPIGLDHVDHYSTAFDLAILTKYALRSKDFRRIVQMPRATIKSVGEKVTHEFESTNYLLDSYLDIQGVKTGTTDAAGESIINLARNNKGREVIIVLLNSPERFQESKRIIDWSFRNYSW